MISFNYIAIINKMDRTIKKILKDINKLNEETFKSNISLSSDKIKELED
jgi:hypothetical protein